VVPGPMPVRRPEEEPIAATVAALLVQVPPVGASVSNAVMPAQREVTPVIALGAGSTVTDLVTELEPDV